MSAECHTCGHDLPLDGECEYCVLRAERDRLREALEEVKNELGVPTPDYPAPAVAAYEIADAALDPPDKGERTSKEE